MKAEFEFGYSVQAATSGDVVIIHIGGTNSWADSESAKELGNRWPSLAELHDEWNEDGLQLGEVRYATVQDNVRVAVVIGQQYVWPENVGDIAAIQRGITAVGKAVSTATSIHITRYGGMHHPEGTWQAIEDLLETHFIQREISVTIHDTYNRAISDGDLDAVKSMVELDVDPNAPNEYGSIPISWAVTNPKTAEPIVRYLLEIGVTKPDELLSDALVAHRMYGMLDWLVDELIDNSELEPTILHNTANVKYAQRLIDKGADVNAASDDGITPLHLGARLGGTDYVKFLVAHGASATAKDSYGKTPLDYAREWGTNKKTIAFLKETMGIPNRTKKQTEEYLEGKIFEDAHAAVTTFGAAHADEVCYGFIFDCNAQEGGGVMFCFNTTTVKDPSPKELDWMPGDWAYQGFEEHSYFLDGTAPKKFLDLLCRVLVRLENEAAFAKVNCTPQFETLVVDHDENVTQARRRMKRVRKKLSAAASTSNGA